MVLLLAETGVPREDHKSFYVLTLGIEPVSYWCKAIALITELTGQPNVGDDDDNDCMMLMLFMIIRRRRI